MQRVQAALAAGSDGTPPPPLSALEAGAWGLLAWLLPALVACLGAWIRGRPDGPREPRSEALAAAPNASAGSGSGSCALAPTPGTLVVAVPPATAHALMGGGGSRHGGRPSASELLAAHEKSFLGRRDKAKLKNIISQLPPLEERRRLVEDVPHDLHVV